MAWETWAQQIPEHEKSILRSAGAIMTKENRWVNQEGLPMWDTGNKENLRETGILKKAWREWKVAP